MKIPCEAQRTLDALITNAPSEAQLVQTTTHKACHRFRVHLPKENKRKQHPVRTTASLALAPGSRIHRSCKIFRTARNTERSLGACTATICGHVFGCVEVNIRVPPLEERTNIAVLFAIRHSPTLALPFFATRAQLQLVDGRDRVLRRRLGHRCSHRISKTIAIREVHYKARHSLRVHATDTAAAVRNLSILLQAEELCSVQNNVRTERRT